MNCKSVSNQLRAVHPNLKALVHFGVAVLATYWVAGLTKRWIEDRGIQLGVRLIKTQSSRDKSVQG